MIVETKKAKLRVQTHGDPDNPPVIMSHSLALDMRSWDLLVPVLKENYYVIQYDTRGHGGSSVSEKEFTIAELASDVLDLLEYLNVPKVHFIGLSMGGMIGQYLAINHGKSLLSVTIAASISRIDASLKPLWYERIEVARRDGLSALVDATLQRWFTEEAFEKQPNLIQDVRAQILATPVEGFTQACKAISDLDLTEELSKVAVPCLVIVGDQDVGTPPAASELIHSKIKGSQYHLIENAAHQVALERSDQFNSIVCDFLSRM